jgi:hypothetical protein
VSVPDPESRHVLLRVVCSAPGLISVILPSEIFEVSKRVLTLFLGKAEIQRRRNFENFELFVY